MVAALVRRAATPLTRHICAATTRSPSSAAFRRHHHSQIEHTMKNWMAACSVLLGASAVAFGGLSILSSHYRADYLKASNDLFRTKFKNRFEDDLNNRVKNAVEVMLSKRALEASNALDQPPSGTGGSSGGISSYGG